MYRDQSVKKKLLKPAEFAEKQLLEAILESRYHPGDALPAERMLAEEIGVTRPTLRETLQRLAKEGWVTIRHGKPTIVNDFQQSGGLGMLNSLTRYGKHLSKDMVSHLLEVRTTLMPDIAQKAAERNPGTVRDYLESAPLLEDIPTAFTQYDWGLHQCMVRATENPVYNMILNDFQPLYLVQGDRYFEIDGARGASRNFYQELLKAFNEPRIHIKPLVETVMIKSQEIWKTIA